MELTLADGRVLELREFGDPDGLPVILFPGTPGTAGAGALVSDAAAAAGVRLVAVSRPGYGASSASPPGLASTARDVGELIDSLGVDRVGVHGISGGGPFALGLAAVAPERVTSVVVSAGPGSYAEVGGLSETEVQAVALADSGDLAGARRLFEADAAAQFGDARRQTLSEFTAQVFPAGPPATSYLDRHPELHHVFVADMHRAVQQLDGYVRDNLSWCGSWDVDLVTVTRPVLLLHGRQDHMVPVAHGEWLHARLPTSELSIHDGGHGDITFGLASEAYEFLVGRSQGRTSPDS